MNKVKLFSVDYTYICLFTVLDTFVEFSSPSYIGSESLKGVPVNLVLTKGGISREEHIVINVFATSHSRLSAEGMVYMHLYTATYTCVHTCACAYMLVALYKKCYIHTYM